jgi:hypothetical protein
MAMAKGWWFPLNSRKAHYFAEGQAVSLCGRWRCLGNPEKEDYGHESADNCKECMKRRAAIAKKGEASDG